MLLSVGFVQAFFHKRIDTIMCILPIIMYLIFQCFYVKCKETTVKKFIQDVALLGYTCQEDKVLFTLDMRRLKCAARCSEDQSCLSIVYDPDNYHCIGCASLAGVSDTTQSTSLFYRLEVESSYVGCFEDCPRILDDEFTSSSSMTTEECLEYCTSMSYAYAMTEYSSQCFCGDSDNFLELDAQTPDSECNYSCSGDSSQMCGGFCRGSMHRTGLPGGGT